MKSNDLARADHGAYADLNGEPRLRAMRAARFGRMEVIGSDQGAGRLYRCPYGHDVWSSWGHAEHHANTCPAADVAGAVREARQ